MGPKQCFSNYLINSIYATYSASEEGSALVANSDELLFGGGGGVHVDLDFSADGSVKSTAQSSVGGNSDVDLLLCSIGGLNFKLLTRCK